MPRLSVIRGSVTSPGKAVAVAVEAAVEFYKGNPTTDRQLPTPPRVPIQAGLAMIDPTSKVISRTTRQTFELR
jgi:hypothetical protein